MHGTSCHFRLGKAALKQPLFGKGTCAICVLQSFSFVTVVVAVGETTLPGAPQAANRMVIRTITLRTLCIFFCTRLDDFIAIPPFDSAQVLRYLMNRLSSKRHLDESITCICCNCKYIKQAGGVKMHQTMKLAESF